MERKTQNRKKTILLILTLLILTSCSDFLDRKPLGNAVEGELKNSGGFDGKVFGLYGKFRATSGDDRSGMAGLAFAFLHSIRSDDAVKGYVESNTATYEASGDRYAYTSGDTWLVQQYWFNHYNFIDDTNDILHLIDSLKLVDPATNVNQGEATFFRAYSYFDLVRTFGEIPKIDFKIRKIGDANIVKSSVAEIYALIDKDLTFASSNLPAMWDRTYSGRLTSGAANAMWAKTKLYRSDWGGALSLCEMVINSGLYSLYPSYAEFFTEFGENSSESILEVQNYVSTTGAINYCNEVVERTGIRGGGFFNQGWGWNQPSQSLVDAYEANDPRKMATILFRGQPDGYGKIIPTDLQLPYWNRKVYANPDRILAAGLTRPEFLNVRLLRYADVLLMAAEAANELGNTAKAIDYLNRVRARARGGNPTLLPDILSTDQVALRAAIKHERRVELAMEYDRFFDLVRWCDAQNVLGPDGYTERCKYYPIPQIVIDRSQGIIKQNSDWN
jgi:starch-binding outer membrane protein, SusD/RagB family